jgi:hypothetical protein
MSSSSGPVDRFHFRSLCILEPNGILCEIATDGPGFATDEPLDSLGERLSLPPFLAPRASGDTWYHHRFAERSKPLGLRFSGGLPDGPGRRTIGRLTCRRLFRFAGRTS